MVFILIDDDPIINLIHRKVIESTCQELTSGIIQFSSAGEALKFMSCESFGRDSKFIVLLDLNMPGLNGWEFLDRLGTFPGPWKNIYILSSSVAQMDISKAKSYAIVKGFLTKPLSKSSLKSIVGE